MALLLNNLKIDEKFTAVHCTWTEADLLKKFVNKKGNVCICPLTEVRISSDIPTMLLVESIRQLNLGIHCV